MFLLFLLAFQRRHDRRANGQHHEGIARANRIFQLERRRCHGIFRRIRLARLQRAAVQLVINGIRRRAALYRQAERRVCLRPPEPRQFVLLIAAQF